MTQIKILFIDQSIKDGGGGRSLFYILKFINKNAFEPIAYLPDEEGVLPERIEKEGVCELIREPLLHSSNKVARLKKKAADENIFERIYSLVLNYAELFYLTFFKLPSLVKKRSIDILYANNITTRMMAGFVGLVTGCKVVWHSRDVPSGKDRVIQKFLARRHPLKKVICVSENNRRFFPSPAEKSIVVHNGIDAEEFNSVTITKKLRNEFHIPQNAVVFGVTGRILPKKGYASFLRAGKIASENCPEIPLRFVIAGGAFKEQQQQHFDELKQLAKTLQIEDRVIFTGFIADVKSYVNDFDALVAPSEWEEPCPRTVLEGMALNLPVLGFKMGGIPELVANGETGLLYDCADYKGLADGMITLIRDPQLRKTMGQKGRKRIENFFDIVEKTKEIDRILLEVDSH
ncbi:glycosyltransferase family 4 protein [bacterium]|nr:glycosyltransferase family 4 protein [bacterium]